jgi:hypothetical protein
MGAVAPIVGAGLSVVGGLSQASQQRQQANAQKKAIAAQAEVEQLNSRLQLLNLNQQQALAEVQSELQSAAEKQAYVGRLAAIDQQETYNSMALAQAGLQANVQEQLAGAQANQANVDSLQQLVGAEAGIGRELVQAIANSGQEQAGLVERMQKMNTNQRQGFISSLLDLAASSGGTNEALRLLSESTTTADSGQVARATEKQGLSQTLAEDSSTALRASAEATRAGTVAQANLQAGDSRFAARQQALDVQTSGEVAKQAFASERLATEGAYAASGLARGVEDSARRASVRANKEVLERGATLSQATASAQMQGVRSPGFFDYVGVLGGGATTYLNMGGSLGFLQNNRRPSSSAIRRGTDATNVNYNIG